MKVLRNGGHPSEHEDQQELSLNIRNMLDLGDMALTTRDYLREALLNKGS
jgi:hypothetical protein